MKTIERLSVSRKEVAQMIDEAVALQTHWFNHWKDNRLDTQENAEALRNYTALRGVAKALRWVLDPERESPLR